MARFSNENPLCGGHHHSVRSGAVLLVRPLAGAIGMYMGFMLGVFLVPILFRLALASLIFVSISTVPTFKSLSFDDPARIRTAAFALALAALSLASISCVSGACFS